MTTHSEKPAEPGATDNPVSTPRIREVYLKLTSPAGCLSLGVRQSMEARAERLLVVTDVFEIEGRGVMLYPWIPLAQLRDGNTEMLVLLRKPDGAEQRVLARFTMPHVPHPDRMGFACLLPEMKKADVPVGSEICRFIQG